MPMAEATPVAAEAAPVETEAVAEEAEVAPEFWVEAALIAIEAAP